MINEIIKLIDPNKFEMFFKEEEIKNDDYVIVKPTYMSICAADQRYYQGKRAREILNKKLPLTLIHECIGKVVYDVKNQFKKNIEPLNEELKKVIERIHILDLVQKMDLCKA